MKGGAGGGKTDMNQQEGTYEKVMRQGIPHSAPVPLRGTVANGLCCDPEDVPDAV